MSRLNEMRYALPGDVVELLTGDGSGDLELFHIQGAVANALERLESLDKRRQVDSEALASVSGRLALLASRIQRLEARAGIRLDPGDEDGDL